MKFLKVDSKSSCANLSVFVSERLKKEEGSNGRVAKRGPAAPHGNGVGALETDGVFMLRAASDVMMNSGMEP